MTAIGSSLSLECVFVYMPVTMFITGRLGNLSFPSLSFALAKNISSYISHTMLVAILSGDGVGGQITRGGWCSTLFYLTSLCWMRNPKRPIATHYSAPYCQERVSKCFLKWNELLFSNKTFWLEKRLTDVN